MNKPEDQKAFEILDLKPDSTKDDISKRYGILARKFRTVERDEKGNTIDDITRAYNLLMGITFKDEKEEDRQRALRENPPFLARLLKKDPIKIENFFHYYKTHMILSVLLLFVLFFSIRSCINRVPSDLVVVLYGEVMVQDEQLIQEQIKENIPELVAPDVQHIPTNENDPQYQMAVQMKLLAMMSAREIDIMIMDKTNFEMYAGQEIFMPLEDIMDDLDLPEERFVKAAPIINETEDGELVKGPLQAYGVSISDSNFAKEKQIYGNNPVAAIVSNSTRVDIAIRFIKTIK